MMNDMNPTNFLICIAIASSWFMFGLSRPREDRELGIASLYASVAFFCLGILALLN